MHRLAFAKFKLSLAFAVITAQLLCGQTQATVPAECLCIGQVKSPCEAAGASDLAEVFIGTVTGVNRSGIGGIDRIDFKIERVLRGDSLESATVAFRTFHCIPFFIRDPFELKHRYVVYASQRGDVSEFYVSSCSRIAAAEEAQGDIQYWRELENIPPKATLSGTVKRYLRTKEDFPLHTTDEEKIFEIEPQSGWEVFVKGQHKTYSLKTDANGYFELGNLDAGTYLISTSGHSGSDRSTVTVALKSKTCATVDFREDPNGRLRILGAGRE